LHIFFKLLFRDSEISGGARVAGFTRAMLGMRGAQDLGKNRSWCPAVIGTTFSALSWRKDLPEPLGFFGRINTTVDDMKRLWILR